GGQVEQQLFAGLVVEHGLQGAVTFRGGVLGVRPDVEVEPGAVLEEESIRGTIYLFKNNTDSAGNSYGCHENYLVAREGDFTGLTDGLIPFLVSRQVFAGAGKVLTTPRGTVFCLSQRADHIWEGVSSATTRSRPIINTRDEPHADAEAYRRLHVIVGDSNMNEFTSWLKIATTDLVLRMLEEAPVTRDLTLDNAIRAIRDVSHDITGTRRVPLANGREMSALDLQEVYLEQVDRFIRVRADTTDADRDVVSKWAWVLDNLRHRPQQLRAHLDWVAKHELVEHWRTRHDAALSDPRVAMLDLAYHDLDPQRGLFHVLQRRGDTVRLLTDDQITAAVDEPPATTRAALRGRFITAAKAAGRDFTVDWVHLKLNDQAQRTVLCKDPLSSSDERVDRMIASL
ncbi:MAG TPA: proteasome accessory factor PafA2 family protein, partial [Nitriliruptoraceae bacterium]|nr:proteasome accessory factor PafA2 family protein [Nitriliruptoraceae bacterium]